MINVAAATWTLGILLLVNVLAVIGWGILCEHAASSDDGGNLLVDLAMQPDDLTLVMARYDSLFPPGMVKSRT